MITFVRGLLAGAVAQSPRGSILVMDVHGMGYEIFTNTRTVQHCPAAGAEITVFTSLVVREDAMLLVGFLTREERDLFNILQSASGVGVKVALALLSELSVPELVQAVITEEFKPLTAAKGVGPKLAQKIVLELREKMTAWREGASTTEWAEPLPSGRMPVMNEAYVEAETVLLSLGYTPEEVRGSLRAIQDNLDEAAPNAETVLRESLRWLAHV